MTTKDSPLAFDDKGRAIPMAGAEAALLDTVKSGEEAKVQGGPNPDQDDGWQDTHTIRAEFLRHLCLHPKLYKIDPRGVKLSGARIFGLLDLQAADLKRPLWILETRFTHAPILMDASTRSLGLQRSHLPGLTADRLTVTGTLRLNASTFSGEVRLSCVHITGNMSCSNATLDNPDGKAFTADGLITGGEVFLRSVTIRGETRLLGADIAGNLQCDNATFHNPSDDAFSADRLKCGGNVVLDTVICRGQTRLPGADITGNLDCENANFDNADGSAFSGERMHVHGRLFWHNFTAPPQGDVNFMHAWVGDFIDDGTGWPEAGKLLLDGFCYENLGLPTTADERCEWLATMPKTWNSAPVFLPQPYEQLVKVLRAAGHERDARKIAIAKRDAYRAYLRARAMRKEKGYFIKGEQHYWKRFGLVLGKWTVGYGYWPWLPLVWIALIIVIGGGMFGYAESADYMHVAKERVYMDPAYMADKVLPREYPPFNALAYSIDTMIPFVDLHQENYWEPKADGFWGGFLRLYFWLHIASGWLLATLAAAGLAGIIKKD